jgi:hypothetical protein
VLPADAVAAWADQPGLAMLVFAEDPERFKETLDIAVIVPELHAAAAAPFASACCRRQRRAPWRRVTALRAGRPS